MDGEELVRLWKDPDARADSPVPHPAGEVRAGSGRRVDRHAALIVALGGLAVGAVVVGDLLGTTPTGVTIG
ncbi:hypothetical protein ACIGXM_33500 [Kitasatospora sp. NPDC052896]|uniref:hypothetical protein n=1 Tax=Kitasatospora sp. NPDC052896 TaxID=3364061 RepID=UPI0037C832C8